ncbi:uncharacterized protein LOC143625319 [Bidens hawaiensis]|uniref:uncharacterized protein LOC143625319 n=1 Tax=Bidens hawaiensis TaxID=980011 RepID=UPI004049A345
MRRYSGDLIYLDHHELKSLPELDLRYLQKALGRGSFDENLKGWVMRFLYHQANDGFKYFEVNKDLGLEDEVDANIHRKESKHISDYLLYLLVSYLVMLPIGIACKKLLEVDSLEVLPSKVKGDRCKSALFDGCWLALTLKNMETGRMWKVMSQVWIEILAYAATHCRGFHHEQQLRKGGEFLTHVWLLMAHLGITEQF